ncbi:hypothetical protein BH10CYA1_BH10CYA1_40490 [soil metagenome]
MAAQRIGRPMSSQDVWSEATALQENLLFITNNAKSSHFAAIS